jgi:hypothetical protein
MDNAILKKKLNTFKAGESGQLRAVSDDVVMEVLRAWENWPGKASDLYRELGLSKMQLVTMIQKGKRLVKSGVVQESEFKEVAVAGTEAVGLRPCVGIELVWGEGKVIRFPGVEPLLDFLKKAA